MPQDLAKIRWVDAQGAPVSCIEKLKVLIESLEELRSIAQDAFDDAVLMGCDEAQIRDVMTRLIADIENSYVSAGDRT